MGNAKSITAVFERLNTDRHLSRVEPGMYVAATGLVLYEGLDSRSGVARKYKGTKEIPWQAPPGDNTGIGSFWDERGDTMFVFVHNSNGEHCLVRHYPAEPTARTIPIPAMNLSKSHPVTGVAFLNGTTLAFTDGQDYVKFIDIDRADETAKKSVVRIYFPRPAGIVNNRTFSAQMLLNGVAQGIFFTVGLASAQQVKDVFPMSNVFANAWNANTTLNARFTAKACAGYVELTALQTGFWDVAVVTIDTYLSGSPVTSNCITEYANRYNNQQGYGQTFTREQVTLSTVAPLIPPTVALAVDTSRKTSLVRNRQLQFCYGYRMSDKRHTLTSPISDIALPATSTCQNSAGAQYNCVDISFGDSWLQQPAMRGEIEWVDIYMRDGNANPWFLVKSLSKYEWIYDRTYRFYNDLAPIPADKLFVESGQTFLPPVASALEFFTDSDDNHRFVMGNIIEGDDNPTVTLVPRVFLDDTQSVNRGTATLVARGYIIASRSNPSSAYATNQCIGVYDGSVGPVFGGMGDVTHTGDPEAWMQKIPTGGFPVYAAGTNILAITKQSKPTTNFPCGGNTPTIFAAPPGAHYANRNVYDLTADGNSLFGSPCSDEKRAAARHAIELTGFSVTQDLVMGGLEPGKSYIIRIASHLCDYGTSDIYDLDSASLGWQGTSTRLWGMGTVYVPGFIEPSLFECVVHVPANGAGTTIDIGNFFIVDYTSGDAVGLHYGIDSYLRDYSGRDNGNGYDVRNFAPAEKQVVAFHEFTSGNPTTWTGTQVFPPTISFPWIPPLANSMLDGITFSDHNGFAFFWGARVFPLNVHARIGWLSNTGNPGTGGAISSWGANIATTYTVMNNFPENKWSGDFSGALVQVNGDLPNGVTGPKTTMLFIPNLNQSTLHVRTHVKMVFRDALGAPLAGVRALLTGTHSSQAVSSPAGELEIIAYADNRVNNDDRLLDRLVFDFTGTCRATYPQNPLPVLVTQFQAGLQWSETVDYIVPDIMVTLTGPGSARGFGRGSSRPIGYYLKRWNGDRTAVVWVGDMRVPLLTEDLGLWDPLNYPLNTFSSGVGRISWEIIGDVPKPWIGRWWALQIVLGDDTTRDWYLQWCASSVTYSSEWVPAQNPNGGDPTPVGYSTGLATEIYLSLSDSTTRFNNLNTGSIVNLTDPNVAYLWQRGDMLRILSDRNGHPIYGNVVEVEITGQRGQWLTIKADGSIPELFGGEIIEVFRPRIPVETDFAPYYDMPNGLVVIGDPWGINPFWSQTSGTLEWGDMWLLPTSVPVRLSPSDPWRTVAMVRESQWMSDFFKSSSWGRGKRWFADPYAKVQHRPGLMRYSDSYKPGTNINGLNMFDGLSMRQAENGLGPIMILCSIGNEILGVCKVGIFAVYKGVEQLENDTDSRVKVAGGILGQVRPFEDRLGTGDPLSFVRGVTNAFWFSRANGDVIQYASNRPSGMGETHGAKTWLMAKGARMDDACNVCSGWDMVHGEFIFSFGEHKWGDGYESHLVPADSIKFHDKRNAWTSNLQFAPQVWGRTRLRLFSMAGGQLWEHHVTPRYNETYGVTHPMRIAPAFVAGINVIWKSLWIRPKGERWACDRAWNDDGQETNMPSEIFKSQESYRTTALKRDLNDADPKWPTPEQRFNYGAEMRSPEIAVSLSHEGNGYAELRGATLTMEESSNAYPSQ